MGAGVTAGRGTAGAAVETAGWTGLGWTGLVEGAAVGRPMRGGVVVPGDSAVGCAHTGRAALCRSGCAGRSVPRAGEHRCRSRTDVSRSTAAVHRDRTGRLPTYIPAGAGVPGRHRAGPRRTYARDAFQ
ncbi:hypothetical protein CP972_33220 [Streptomyces prasinus]|uniref:Uncharacterized protein n=1 Tax=Streptomyces prasinus TaxID=67345 RepID=A0ABX6B528_9ACTN|nr:hypothetical protein CP972_33220 [Streptomyces prasinus]